MSENLQTVRLLTDHFRASGQAMEVAYYHNCVGPVNSGKMQQVFANANIAKSV